MVTWHCAYRVTRLAAIDLDCKRLAVRWNCCHPRKANPRRPTRGSQSLNWLAGPPENAIVPKNGELEKHVAGHRRGVARGTT